ncbi:AAA family ATPase [Agrobacterium tumefaciens]|uniref:AAA family ATPase n=1 Tax=Agrobacterium tumefaciens TaxID=358 RepID=UPI00278357E1|nr:AAA family ATPase [Agrobacterium tumefaciens]MDP9875245.1 ABC-type multidrug transport system ATPase subunit [Agrobacterium tumefaciens]MDP9980366.1 ABC-type multidrug transport system ATPase subunit [Agrobacterium tumefaciens]
MKIKRLSVAGLRGFDHATFEFDPHFTLLVGVNGVGKSSVLEALRVSLSRVLPKFTASRSTPLAFAAEDIRQVSASLTVDLELDFPEGQRNLLLHKPREQFIPDEEGSVRNATLDTPEREELSPPRWPNADPSGNQPIAIYFGTRRSHPTDEQIKIGRSRGGQAAAFADALSDVRPLHLRDMASWMLAQEALAEELPRAGSHLEALKSAAARFLPTCNGLRATNGADKPRLLILKDGIELDVRYLSEGERGVLALALDLARRLSQANPFLDDPVRDGVGVVLIDEIDMHMHPLWQRQIVSLLTETFRGCQFIATTHSPQVIGEVPHNRILLIKNGQVFSPARSFGIDSSRVLEEVMDTKSRNAGVEDKIAKIAKLIGDGKADAARAEIKQLSADIGEDDPEITRAMTLLDFMEGDA